MSSPHLFYKVDAALNQPRALRSANSGPVGLDVLVARRGVDKAAQETRFFVGGIGSQPVIVTLIVEGDYEILIDYGGVVFGRFLRIRPLGAAGG